MIVYTWKPSFLKTATLAGSLFAASLGTASADAIRYADWDNEACIRCQELLSDYFPSVTEATNGEVEIQPFFNAVLGGGGDMLNMVRDGVADFGGVWSGYFSNEFPAQSVFATIPQGPISYENQLYFFREVYSRVPEIKEELARNNHEVIMIGPLLHLGFASRSPITSLADIEGQKWRAGNKWLLGLLEAQDASPVSLAWGDVYSGLQTGVIDGVLANYDGINNMKFYEQANHVLISESTWMPVPFTYTVRKDYWDGLSDETKAAWLEVSADFEMHMGDVLAGERSRIIETQKAAGVTINTMSDSDLADWASAETAANLQAQWVEDAKAAGLSNAEDVLAAVIEIHAEAMARE